MAQTAHASAPDRFAATSAERERIQNTSDHLYTKPRAVNGAARNNMRYDSVLRRIADRSVLLRRLSSRRRLARLDPKAVESRALRIIGGGAGSPTHP